MNINELEELAKAATPGPWMHEPTGAENTVFGDTRSNVIRIGDYCFELSRTCTPDAKHIAAANPSEILELIAAYLESVAALRAMVIYARADRCGLKIADDALDTAKRLGVE